MKTFSSITLATLAALVMGVYSAPMPEQEASAELTEAEFNNTLDARGLRKLSVSLFSDTNCQVPSGEVEIGGLTCREHTYGGSFKLLNNGKNAGLAGHMQIHYTDTGACVGEFSDWGIKTFVGNGGCIVPPKKATGVFWGV